MLDKEWQWLHFAVGNPSLTRSMGSSIVVLKHWSRGQIVVVRDNVYQDVPLIPWPIRTALERPDICVIVEMFYGVVLDGNSHHWFVGIFVQVD